MGGWTVNLESWGLADESASGQTEIWLLNAQGNLDLRAFYPLEPTMHMSILTNTYQSLTRGVARGGADNLATP